MTVYCDTSVMVSAFSAEAKSAIVRRWLAAREHDVAISAWVVTEFSGALAMKRRMGVVDEAGWAAVMAAWRPFSDRVLRQSVEPHHFVQAAALMDRGDLKLRSADALHLAIVVDRTWTIATLDHDLAAAARRLGVGTDPFCLDSNSTESY